MACYSNETKHKCSKVVMVVSIAIFVLGLLTTIYGFGQAGVGSEITKELSKDYELAQ
jgi:hypothetical protein